MELFKLKLTNFEAHSQINNTVLVGLEEGAEAGNPNKMIDGILRYIFDLKVDDMVPEMERHHWSLRPCPGPSFSVTHADDQVANYFESLGEEEGADLE